MKKLLVIMGVLLGFTVVVGVGASLWWDQQRAEVERARAERLAALEKMNERWQSPKPLTARDACDLLAWHSLDESRAIEAEVRHALQVDCAQARATQINEGVILVEGALMAPEMDNVIFGGGFRTAYCLAFRENSWRIDGEAWRLDECEYKVTGEAVEKQVNANRHNRFRAHLDRIEEALDGAMPEKCPQIETEEEIVGTVLIPFEPAPRSRRLFQSSYYESCTTEAAECNRDEPPRWVVVTRNLEEVTPEITDDDGFIGGRVRGSVLLFDSDTSKFVCQTHLDYELDSQIVKSKYDSLESYWQKVRAEAFCTAVADMSQGRLEVDSHHCK